jgi:hypothetical protein
LGRAISKQDSFVTAQHYLENPPAHGARAGLATKISMLAHPKGPMWIQRNGVDVNLGGSGSERRINNEEEPEEIDDVVHVERVSGAKGKGASSSHVGDRVARTPLPLNWPLCAPSNCYP